MCTSTVCRVVEWHPRRLVLPVEWVMTVPGEAEPVAVIRRLRIRGRTAFRAVTWSRRSAARQLIGYYPSGDAAAAAVWRKHCDDRRTQHESASRAHGRSKP